MSQQQTAIPALIAAPKPWQERLEAVLAMMREMSLQTDPQDMVSSYGRRARSLTRSDGGLSLSRRNLQHPWYRITRSTLWHEPINPWREPERLPLLDKGMLGELIYANEPLIINDLRVPADDPAAEHLAGYGSMTFIPMFDMGEAINAVVTLRREPNAFDPEQLPEAVWLVNLFGRATHNLVLRSQLQIALDQAERELNLVADIQRSLLPAELPKIPGLDLAVYYHTARQAGGDYYDFFALPDGRWGILIADVSGHGTPAAVVMAVTHSIAHTFPGAPSPPSGMLDYLNGKLANRQAISPASFVTAFYAIYDPATRQLSYSSAGHNPPRLRRASDHEIVALDEAQSLPLGISADEKYIEQTIQLGYGDQLILYTDGITEATDSAGQMFGVEGLDAAINPCSRTDAAAALSGVVRTLDRFVQGLPAKDDQTLLCVRMT